MLDLTKAPLLEQGPRRRRQPIERRSVRVAGRGEAVTGLERLYRVERRHLKSFGRHRILLTGGNQGDLSNQSLAQIQRPIEDLLRDEECRRSLRCIDW